MPKRSYLDAFEHSDSSLRSDHEDVVSLLSDQEEEEELPALSGRSSPVRTTAPTTRGRVIPVQYRFCVYLSDVVDDAGNGLYSLDFD